MLARSPRRLLLSLLGSLLLTGAVAQVSIPTFGSRVSDESEAGVVEEVIGLFTDRLRRAVRDEGITVNEGELITPGIAGSLDREYARLIAELDDSRFAVSGEIAQNSAGPQLREPYVVNLIVVDVQQDRVSDLISRPLANYSITFVANDLAREIVEFMRQATELPSGNAGVFVSSEPEGASVYVNGVRLGTTPLPDVLLLRQGRYELDVRMEGFLPEVRTIDAREGMTTIEHVQLAPLTGGSILVESTPPARVYVGEEGYGFTPTFIPAPPGTVNVRLEREGFKAVTATVPVRNYRTSRLNLELEAVQEPLIYWSLNRDQQIFIDGVRQLGGYARWIRSGRATVQLLRGGTTRSFELFIPERGVYELDLETGELHARNPG